MGNSLIFTSNSFATAVSFATASAATASGFQPSSANTVYDIMGGTTSYDRRLYGISCTSTFGTIETVSVYLWDGISNKQMYQVSIPANSGNSTTISAVDVFGNINGSSIFQKQKDANGVPYYNLTAGWSIRISYGTTLTGSAVLNFISTGETYQ